MQLSLFLSGLTLSIYDNSVPPALAAELDMAGPVPVQVDFHYAPGDPGSRYAPNGDPGEPPTPEEFDIYHVLCPRGLVLTARGIRLEFAPGFDLNEFISGSDLAALEDDLLRALREPDDVE